MRNNSLLLKFAITGLLATQSVTGVYASDKLSNEWKEATIATHYTLNDLLDSYDLKVLVADDVATLKGVVSSDVEKELAGEIADNVDGISTVKNEIEVDKKYIRKERSSDISIGQKLSDATTTAKVKSRFLWSSGIPALSINVDTLRSVVTLKGEVPQPAQKELAGKLAANTRGVSRVKNEINVTSLGKGNKVGNIDLKKVENNAGEAIEGVGETLSDAWVTGKVSTSLNFTRSLSVDSLNVDTKDGVVTLSGHAETSADKELASEIAKDIKGVKTVVNDMKVL